MNGDVMFGPFGKMGSFESLYWPGGGPSFCREQNYVTEHFHQVNLVFLRDNKKKTTVRSKKAQLAVCKDTRGQRTS